MPRHQVDLPLRLEREGFVALLPGLALQVDLHQPCRHQRRQQTKEGANGERHGSLPVRGQGSAA